MKVLELDQYPSLNPDDFGITWEVTGNCTYDCRYCVLHYKEPYKYPTGTIKLINDLSKSKNIILTLFGGEPTAHPDFLKILEELDSSLDLGVFTNLSKGIAFFEKVLEVRPNLKFETSYHPSQADLRKYCKTVEFLLAKKCQVSIAYMYDTPYAMNQACYETLSKLCPDVTPFKIDYPDQGFTADELSWFLKENQDKTKNILVTYEDNGKLVTRETTPGFLWANNINNFKYFRCDCGKNCFYISSQGDVYPCLDYKKKNLGKFFSVYESYAESLGKVLKQGVICKSEECTSEICVPKQRILNK